MMPFASFINALLARQVEGAARFSRLDDRPFMKITETLFKSEGSNNRGLLNGIKGGGQDGGGQEGVRIFVSTLPSEVVVDKSKWHDLKVNQSVRLPPTLSSKAWSWAFYYEISVQVKRSGLLAMDDKWVQVAKYGCGSR